MPRRVVETGGAAPPCRWKGNASDLNKHVASCGPARSAGLVGDGDRAFDLKRTESSSYAGLRPEAEQEAAGKVQQGRGCQPPVDGPRKKLAVAQAGKLEGKAGLVRGEGQELEDVMGSTGNAGKRTLRSGGVRLRGKGKTD